VLACAVCAGSGACLRVVVCVSTHALLRSDACAVFASHLTSMHLMVVYDAFSTCNSVVVIILWYCVCVDSDWVKCV
jgi:hypothetical protein